MKESDQKPESEGSANALYQRQKRKQNTLLPNVFYLGGATLVTLNTLESTVPSLLLACQRLRNHELTDRNLDNLFQWKMD